MPEVITTSGILRYIVIYKKGMVIIMNKQSNLYEEITLSQIQLLLEKALLITEPVEACLLSGGLFNTTYHVWGKASGLDVVLRLGPVNRHLLARFEHNLMEAEKYVYELFKKQGITCSEVLACDTSKKWIDRDFMIVAYIPSIVMCGAPLTPEEKAALHMKVGEQAKSMHCITNQTFGRVSEILSGIAFSQWSEYLLSETEGLCRQLVKGNGMNTEDAARARQVIIKYKNLLDEIKTPRLIHTDLWEGNILLEKHHKERIAAIIDADRAIFGDPDYDLACPWMINNAFLSGYRLEENSFHEEEFDSAKRKTRRDIYNMVYRILEAYVGFYEYNNREAYENNLKDALALIDGLERQSSEAG